MIGYIFKLSAESRVLRCSVIQWPSSSRFLPIGQKKIPKLGSIVVGDTVSVSYNPMSPDMAYLTHNVGKINV